MFREKETFFKSLGIKHSRTALYHPQSNGKVERFNQYLTDQLKIARLEGRFVNEALFSAVSAYRSTHPATTQRSPTELMCGRPMTMPLDRLRNIAPVQKVTFNKDIELNVKITERRNDIHFNNSKHVQTPVLKNGQRVYVRNNLRTTKYDPVWSAPLRVVTKLRETTVRLEDGAVRNTKDLIQTDGIVLSDVPTDMTSAVQDTKPKESVSSAVEPPAFQPVRRSERERRRPAKLGDSASTAFRT